MSTTPPERPGEPMGGRGTMGMGMPGMGIASGARLPIPGNAEFAIWFVIEAILVIIWIVADSVNTNQWCIFTVVLTAFYILSRGIAKASRVLEQ